MVEYFIIAGGQRCGTTFLYEMLDKRPDIEMAKPAKPDPKFFLSSSLFAEGISAYAARYFARLTPFRGERSTTYYEKADVPGRIAAMIPDAKIVLVLREPVHRAISNYWFSVNNGFEDLSMEDAFLHETDRITHYDPALVSTSPFAYLKRGLYVDFIEQFDLYFPRRNIGLFLFEELTTKIDAFREVLAFLGAREDVVSPLPAKAKNASRQRHWSLRPGTFGYLRSYYREANERLAARMGRDLASWEQSLDQLQRVSMG